MPRRTPSKARGKVPRCSKFDLFAPRTFLHPLSRLSKSATSRRGSHFENGARCSTAQGAQQDAQALEHLARRAKLMTACRKLANCLQTAARCPAVTPTVRRCALSKMRFEGARTRAHLRTAELLEHCSAAPGCVLDNPHGISSDDNRRSLACATGYASADGSNNRVPLAMPVPVFWVPLAACPPVLSIQSKPITGRARGT